MVAEAGLYLCSSSVFDALEEMAASKAYFTLAQAMASLAPWGAPDRRPAVVCHRDGRSGTHTLRRTPPHSAAGVTHSDTTPSALPVVAPRPQLASTTREIFVGGDTPARFPWQVRLARADSFSTSHQAVGTDRRLVSASAPSNPGRVYRRRTSVVSCSCARALASTGPRRHQRRLCAACAPSLATTRSS
jgi:hypothetical protein